MLVLPYWTSAPIYRLPIMTVVLIVINCIVSIVALNNPEWLEAMVLKLDGSFEPLTWLSSFFIHADYSHLFGNMIFLWCFGVIVEGRIGHFWMTVCYMAIGLMQSAGLQLAMVGFSQLDPLAARGALGASAAIYGLMVMCFLWSFDDDLISLVLLYPFYINYGLRVSVSIYCGIYLFFDFLEAVLEGWSSGLLHVTGALAGLLVGLVVTPTGLLMGDKPTFFQWLKNGRPSSTASGNRSGSTSHSANDREDEERKQRELVRLQADLRERTQKVRSLISLGQFELAEERMQQLLATNRLAEWDPNTTWSIADGYARESKWERADHMIKLHVEKFPESDFVSVRIRWAQIKLQREMPRKAVLVLKTLRGRPVTQGQKQAVQDLASHARRMIADGVVELE